MTPLQKVALQHQFSGYEVYYKDAAKKDAWTANFQANFWAPKNGGGLLAFINNTYRVITADTRALDLPALQTVGYSFLEGCQSL